MHGKQLRMITISSYRTFGEFNRVLLSSSRVNRNLCNLTAMEDKPVEKSIREKLSKNLNPIHLNIINESHKHNVPRGSETHFKVVVVSDKFEGMSLLNSHRLVNSLLEHELKNGVHALSIEAKTASQWNPKEEVKPSPTCLGGFGK